MSKGAYTYEPGNITEFGKDRMRFELGDTMVEGLADTTALTDEEIQAAIDAYPNKWKRAKLMLLESLCRRFAYEVNTKTGPLSLDMNGSQSYIDNNHYEATVALKLLTGTDADTSGIDSYYGSMKKQLDDLGKELSGKVDIALEDSVISLDESAEIQSLQDQISAITGKISQARTDAEFDTLKIKYSGAELDMDSFNALQEELQTQVSNASDQYEQALTLTLTNLNLQLADGAITQEEYDAAVKEATDGYYAQLNEINARVSSFNLETIAEAWDSSLQGYMPEIEGSTKEKLETALNNALLAHPDVQTWTGE